MKRKLEAVGFREAGQRGSHVKFVKTMMDGTLTATVPKHAEIAVGTLRSILRQVNLSPEAFATL